MGKVELIVDDGKSVKHSKLAELTEEVSAGCSGRCQAVGLLQPLQG